MLLTIKIKNFKVLKDEELEFSNLTIVSGMNSLGKSSLIQTLLLLRQSYQQKVINEGLLLNSNLINIGNGSDALSIAAEEDMFSFVLEWEKGDRLELEFDCLKKSNLQPLRKIHPEEFAFKQALFTSDFQYLSAERIGPASTFPVSDYDIRTLHSLGKNGEYTAHFLYEYGSKPLENKALEHKNARSATLLYNVDAWMAEISPGIKITANVLEEVNQASLHYEFELSDGYTKKFRPENVGFGLTYVLPVVTAVLISKPGDLIIIENPEAHLHPAGQTALANLFTLAAQNGIQIIVETHSDHLLNGVRIATRKELIDPENIAILFFSRKEAETEHAVDITQPFIDKTGRIDQWPVGFLDEWEKNLDKILD